MRTFFEVFKTDNDMEVTVEYGYEDHGNCAAIQECWREPTELGDVAIDVKLTDRERERMEAWIMEHRHWTDEEVDRDYAKNSYELWVEAGKP